MYELPPKDELLLLVGGYLAVVCCSVSQVDLVFDPDCMITVEGPFDLETASGEVIRVETPSLAGKITGMLNQSVVGVEVDESATVLSLVFESGQRLIIPSDEHRESIHLAIGDRTFHV